GLGPDDGAAGGEGVGRRSGGGGQDDAVAAEGGHGAGVDAEDDVDHPRFRGLLDGRLVERAGVEDVLTLVPDGYVEGEALLDGVVALGGAVDSLGEVFSLALGEESHMPEVDAHEGRSGAVEAFGRAQDGPVAAEDDDEFAGVLPLPQFG